MLMKDWGMRGAGLCSSPPVRIRLPYEHYPRKQVDQDLSATRNRSICECRVALQSLFLLFEIIKILFSFFSCAASDFCDKMSLRLNKEQEAIREATAALPVC